MKLAYKIVIFGCIVLAGVLESMLKADSIILRSLQVCPANRQYTIGNTPVGNGSNINYPLVGGYYTDPAKGGQSVTLQLSNYIDTNGIVHPLDGTGLNQWLLDNGYMGNIEDPAKQPNPSWVGSGWTGNPSSNPQAVEYWRKNILGGNVTLKFIHAYILPSLIYYYVSFEVWDESEQPIHHQVIDSQQGQPNYHWQQVCGREVFLPIDNIFVDLYIACRITNNVSLYCGKSGDSQYYFNLGLDT